MCVDLAGLAVEYLQPVDHNRAVMVVMEVPLELSAATEHSNNAATALYLEPSGRFRTHQPGPFDGTNFRVSFLFGYKVAP